jgi:hypothetical protein
MVWQTDERPLDPNQCVRGETQTTCCPLWRLEAKKIRRLPMTDSHKGMLGMLSLGDISHKAAKELSVEVPQAVSGHHV